MSPDIIKFIDRLAGPILILLLGRKKPADVEFVGSILIIRPGGIGDAVLLIPAICALKRKFPDATITVLAEKRNASVFRFCPDVSHVLLYDNPKELFTAIRGKYDVVIDTEQWHRLSAVVARLTKSPLTIGYATNERTKMFTNAVHYSHKDYEMDSFFHLLQPLGIAESEKGKPPFLVVPDEAVIKVNAMIGKLAAKPFIAIFPGSSIPERRWGADKYSEMAARLYRKGIPVVVVGGNSDAATGEKIVAGKFGLNLAGRASLVETAAVIEMSNLLVSGDSGILHLGVGLGKPTVSLFGPGIEKKWAPRGLRHIVVNKNLPCSPCTKFGYTPKCLINARCMADISVAEVVAAIEKLLKEDSGER
jgi:lipopolysaccharide heptosyltransferase II